MRSRSSGRRYAVWLAGLFLSCLLLFRTIFVMETSAFLRKQRATAVAADVDPGSVAFHQETATTTTARESSTNEATVFPRLCRDEPLADPIWEWHFYSSNAASKNETRVTTARKRLLIATYSAFGQYARLLELTSPINKAYAKHWNHDIVVLQGTSVILPWDENCNPPEERSRFNKIDLLLEALYRKDKYDCLLLLDADTLIFDFSFDVSGLLSTTDIMLVAQRTHQDDPPATRNINNGITLWNLHHRLTSQVAEDWNKASRQGIPENRPYRGDQYFLRQVLQSHDRIDAISSVWDEFYYRDGTVVKHFQRSNNRSWNDTGLDTREQRIIDATTEICARYGLDEQRLERRNYTAIPQSSNSSNLVCLPRRKARWDLSSCASNATSPASKRLLMAQYSSYGTYASLLEMTAPINKAYARKWCHDILIVQGTSLLFHGDSPDCEPPSHRAMYNKIPLLLHSISKGDQYDQVLILDADTLVCDLDFDITTILRGEEMLAAQRVNQKDANRTWNVNNGVTLWNLHHNKTERMAQRWLKHTSIGFQDAHKSGLDTHSDQHYFQKALKEEPGAIDAVNALAMEFRYEQGTVVKHFVRPNNNEWAGYGKVRREYKIQRTVETICSNFPKDCEALKYVPYATL